MFMTCGVSWRGESAMHRILACACALLAWLPFALAAQSLPKPAEFYFDEDEAVARAITVVEGRDEQAISQLIRLMERGGRNAERAAAQLAHLSMDTGRIDNGKALYARALQQAATNSAVALSIAWNQGWDLYRIGETEAALQQWIGAFSSR